MAVLPLQDNKSPLAIRRDQVKTQVALVVLLVAMATMPAVSQVRYDLYKVERDQAQVSISIGEINIEDGLDVSPSYIESKLRGTGCFAVDGEPMSITVCGSVSQNGSSISLGNNRRGGRSYAGSYGPMNPPLRNNNGRNWTPMNPPLRNGSYGNYGSYNSYGSYNRAPIRAPRRNTGLGISLSSAETRVTVELTLGSGVSANGTATLKNVGAKLRGLGSFESVSSLDIAALTRRAVDRAVANLKGLMPKSSAKTEKVAVRIAGIRPKSEIHVGSKIVFFRAGEEIASYKVTRIEGERLESEVIREDCLPKEGQDPFKVF